MMEDSWQWKQTSKNLQVKVSCFLFLDNSYSNCNTDTHFLINIFLWSTLKEHSVDLMPMMPMIQILNIMYCWAQTLRYRSLLPMLLNASRLFTMSCFSVFFPLNVQVRNVFSFIYLIFSKPVETPLLLVIVQDILTVCMTKYQTEESVHLSDTTTALTSYRSESVFSPQSHTHNHFRRAKAIVSTICISVTVPVQWDFVVRVFFLFFWSGFSEQLSLVDKWAAILPK